MLSLLIAASLAGAPSMPDYETHDYALELALKQCPAILAIDDLRKKGYQARLDAVAHHESLDDAQKQRLDSACRMFLAGYARAVRATNQR